MRELSTCKYGFCVVAPFLTVQFRGPSVFGYLYSIFVKTNAKTFQTINKQCMVLGMVTQYNLWRLYLFKQLNKIFNCLSTDIKQLSCDTCSRGSDFIPFMLPSPVLFSPLPSSSLLFFAHLFLSCPLDCLDYLISISMSISFKSKLLVPPRT